MEGRDVIVVGASAGGVEPLVELARGLPGDLPAAVFVVLHLPINARSHLPQILARAGPLPAISASDQAPILPRQIYVAPPNRHLVLSRRRMHLADGPRVNGFRPSIDVLFHSAARIFGPRVVGVVLSGSLSDGALGLDIIKATGGVTIVQDPEEARFPSMPQSVIERTRVDHVVPVAQIPLLLAHLTGEAVALPSPTPPQAMPRTGEPEMERASHDEQEGMPLSSQKQPDRASGLTCPNCHGAIWEVTDGTHSHMECRVGHVFSMEAFLGEQAVALEEALWSAINALQERAATLRRLGARFSEARRTAAEYVQQAEELERQARVLRATLSRVIESEATPGPAAADA